MIQVVVCAAIIYPLIMYIDGKRDGVVDGFTVVAFIAVPALTLVLLQLAGGLLGLPAVLLLPFQLLYFAVPMLMCRYQFDYPWGVSSTYGGIVFGVNLVAGVGAVLLLAK